MRITVNETGNRNQGTIIEIDPESSMPGAILRRLLTITKNTDMWVDGENDKLTLRSSVPICRRPSSPPDPLNQPLINHDGDIIARKKDMVRAIIAAEEIWKDHHDLLLPILARVDYLENELEGMRKHLNTTYKIAIEQQHEMSHLREDVAKIHEAVFPAHDAETPF